MSSSFFTVPAAQRKRKRDGVPSASSTAAATKRSRSNGTKAAPKAPQPERDESISGSDSEDDISPDDVGMSDGEDESESEHEGETAAERRLRLAERYLQNVRSEVEQTIGFDAEEIDRDLIAERLKEDVAEGKGRMYRFVVDEYDFAQAVSTQFRYDTECTTSIAVCAPYAFTVAKDMTITKWQLPDPNAPLPTPNKKRQRPLPPPRRRPTKLLQTKGSHREKGQQTYQHHTAPILCVAASEDGKFLVTGGADRKMIVWKQEDLTPLKVFTQHRDAVTSVAFRRGTNQLYSSSADRTVKTWSLNELTCIETLFGHQDQALDVAALSREQCISAGARDRTVRFWKVVEETQLVFRGGASEKKSRRADAAHSYAEGSIDRVAMIDDETFVSGADNGSISLWSLQKKKPVCVIPLAHGCDPSPKREDIFSGMDNAETKPLPPPEPRWITALAVLPYSNLVLSGSWDGQVRIWKVSEDKRRLEPAGVLGRDLGEQQQEANGVADVPNGVVVNGEKKRTKKSKVEPVARGIVNDIGIFERGEAGKDGLGVVVALGKEHRLGRWKKASGGKNGAMVFEIPRLAKN
ncbi:uncharacterized protein E0L32_007445 [Thyridium curvatum]|uniref:Uncharacterized protein n=1 Tax=Thyridium curvatum TaxID=1093900 RepID=A0A507AWU1_9PEZI|nr:uncharacterized protein E0L32_007445 [Thyridium curvatum]TPX11947.1 hypothetical protein E0L32_007445 [Thyridium curvatum]